MSVSPPSARPIVDVSRMLAGAPVASSGQWDSILQCAHWCRGKGAQLVPAYYPGTQIKVTTEQIYRYRVRTRESALQRVWMVALNVEAGAAFASVEVEIRCPATTGTLQRATAYAFDGLSVITYVEVLSAQAEADVEISIGITAPGATATEYVVTQSIACYEQDRPLLPIGSVDEPTPPLTVRAGEPIAMLSAASVAGTLATVANMDARRVSIFQWAEPFSVSRLSAVAADFFALPIRIQGPRIAAGTVAVRWQVYARMSAGGGGGAVSISTSSSGVADSISVTSATAQWIDGGTVSINADKFTLDDGDAGDDLTVTFNGDGTRSVQVFAISIYVESVA